MTPQEQLTAAFFAVLAVAVPMIVGYLQLLRAKIQRERRALVESEARGVVLYAQERRLAEKRDGDWAAKVAIDLLMERTGVSDEEAAFYVRAAVAAEPGYGETGKKGGAS